MAGLKNVLQIRATQSQSQILTPQMQQAIKLLQLSSIELQQQIRQTVESNPMLEIDDSSLSSMEESLDAMSENDNSDNDDYDPFDNDNLDTDFSNYEGQSSDLNNLEHVATADHEIESTQLAEDNKTQDQLSDSLSNLTSGIRQSKGLSIDDDSVYEGETTETLHDHLTWQLELSPLEGADKFIAQIIIDAIDESGYLTDTTENILTSVQESFPETSHEDVLAILKLIQHYDPLGVGSRNIQECLRLQLENLPEDTKYKKEALTVVNDHLNLLSNRDFRSLCQKLSVKEDTLKEIIALITSLNPRPGNYTVSKRNDFIVPDVVVVKDANGEYTAELNPTSNIIVRINDSYRQLANQARTKEEKSFFKNNLQEANWFIQSLEKRNETLLKVARCIVKHQKAFMEEGASAMIPMVLNDVATEIQMHESSISRITTEKYIYTPKGTFELKYFFSSSVSTDDGGAASSTAIKSLIKEYISNENRRKPLSDSKIAQMLNDKGLNVARRTVAKYRESLGIASSSQRKQLV